MGPVDGHGISTLLRNPSCMKFIVVMLIAFLLVATMASCGGGSGGSSKDPQSPPPAPVPSTRTDLLFGYYGDASRESAQNLVWVPAWGPSGTSQEKQAVSNAQVEQLKSAKAAGITDAVVDVSHLLFDPFAQTGRFEYTGKVLAQVRLNDFLDDLNQAGVLDIVKTLVLIDEPNINLITQSSFPLAAQDARQVLASMGLSRIKLAVIYAPVGGYVGIDQFDWVGIDSYDEYDRVLKTKVVDLKSLMRPSQKLLLIPGGASPWKQNPWSFYNYAQADPQVVAIIAFSWFGYEGYAERGIAVNGMKDVYEEVAHRIRKDNR